MRIRDFIYRTALPAMVCLGLAATARGAVTVTNTPAVTSTAYNGAITLLVSGVTNGEPVVVRKYLDMNTNGVIDAPDLLVQRFTLTEGQASVFGTFTNINVPGDFGSVTGQITTTIDFQSQDVAQKLAGQYLYRLGSPTARFTAVTNRFVVTNAPLTQGFTGHVIHGVTNVPGAFVMLFDPATNGDLTPLAGAVADNAGAYQINAAPGTYRLLAGESNFVADIAAAPVLTLTSNAVLNADLNLIAATQSISGRLIESPYSGYLRSGFSYGITVNGNPFASTNLSYTYTIFSSSCAYFQNLVAANVLVSAPIVSTALVQIRGKLWYAAPTTDSTNGLYQTTLTRSATNDQVCLDESYTVYAGDVMSDQTSPVGVPGTLMFARSTNGLLAIVFTDNSSNFLARVTSGRWMVSPDAAALQIHGDLKYQAAATNDTTGGNVSGVTLTVPKASAFVYGTVKNSSGQPLPGIWMEGSDTNHQYELAGLRTMTNGYYAAGAIAGTWRLRVATNNPSLAGLAVVPASLQTNLIANQALLQNFIVETSTNTTANFQFTAPHQFSFDFTGNIGDSYAAQYATNLSSPAWTTFLTFLLATNPFTIADTNAVSTPRFYRVIVN